MKGAFQDRYPELVTPGPSFAGVVTSLSVAGWTCSFSAELEPQPPGSAPDWQFPYEVPVEIGPDGEEVLRGEIALARALCDAALARNPRLVEAEIREWIARSRHADDDERVWQERYQGELEEAPGIRFALEHSPTELMRRAGLHSRQQDALRRQLAGEGPRQIARELATSETTVRRWLQDSLERLRELRDRTDLHARVKAALARSGDLLESAAAEHYRARRRERPAEPVELVPDIVAVTER